MPLSLNTVFRYDPTRKGCIEHMNRFFRQIRLFADLIQQQLADLLGTSPLRIWHRGHEALSGTMFRQPLCAFFQKREAERSTETRRNEERKIYV